MSDGYCCKERRKYKRYAVKSGAIAITDKRLGEISDISTDGLSFRYIYWDEEPFIKYSTLTIMVADDSFLLEKIPIEIVSDQFIKNSFTFSTLILKRRSVKFYDLQPSHINLLRDFILIYGLWEI